MYLFLKVFNYELHHLKTSKIQFDFEILLWNGTDLLMTSHTHRSPNPHPRPHPRPQPSPHPSDLILQVLFWDMRVFWRSPFVLASIATENSTEKITEKITTMWHTMKGASDNKRLFLKPFKRTFPPVNYFVSSTFYFCYDHKWNIHAIVPLGKSKLTVILVNDVSVLKYTAHST